MPWQSIGHLVEDAARRHARRPLFISEGARVSFAEANARTDRAANVLRSLGVAKGDRVAVMLPNGVDFPIVWFALAKLGGVMVPVNVHYHDHDLTHALRDSEAGVLIVHADHLSQWERVRERVPSMKETLVVGAGNDPRDLHFRMASASDEFPIANVGAGDMLNIQYTSGTTGAPKGCMLSHAYWLQIGQLAADYFRLSPDDIDLTAQPFYYMDPQWNTIACLVGGAPLVILPRFSPSHFWGEVVEHGATVVYLIGTMPFYLLKQPENPALERGHRLRAVLCSGIHPGFHAEFERRWGVPWREAFGMTETGVDLLVPLDDAESVGSGAMGRPISTKEARVVDALGHDLPDGQVGELVVRGTPAMLGYWRNPEATREFMRDGWMHTGDLAYRDTQGYFHWQARLKDTIRRSGENISTAEVEGVLMEHPAVRAAAVVPVPDGLRGEEVKAYLVLQAGQTPESAPPESILDFARERLAYFKVPRYVEYMDDLPRTASERVEKHKLMAAKPDLRAGSYDAVDKVWR